MEKKKSTYQKLKEKNKHLQNCLNTLVANPDSQEAIMIKMQVKMSLDIEKQVMSGDILNINEFGMSGLNKLIEPN